MNKPDPDAQKPRPEAFDNPAWNPPAAQAVRALTLGVLEKGIFTPDEWASYLRRVALVPR